MSEPSDVTTNPAFILSTDAASRQEVYYEKWKSLYINEGSSDYPFPAGDEIVDRLGAFAGHPTVEGIALHTNPGTTCTEGQGYAMFVAGMRKDLATLKGLVLGWQGMGQGLTGTPACGGCVASDADWPIPTPQVRQGASRQGSPCGS